MDISVPEITSKIRLSGIQGVVFQTQVTILWFIIPIEQSQEVIGASSVFQIQAETTGSSRVEPIEDTWAETDRGQQGLDQTQALG
jgi:hypothetical protein